MFFKIGVLKNFEMFSGKHLCRSLFFSYEKETPTQVLSCEYYEVFKNSFFYRTPRVCASEGLHHRFFTEKFPGSGKLYQQLEHEYRNQSRWWDVYVCLMVLLNVQYIKLNTFNKHSLRHRDLTDFRANRFLKNETFPCVINGWNNPDPDIRSSSADGVFRNVSLNFIRPNTLKPYNFNGFVW